MFKATTIADKYPIPRIQDFTQNLCGMKIFTKLDLKRAYHQIQMNEEDIEETAITTPFALFEYRVMVFGLCTAAQSFQRFIDHVLHGLIFEIAYLDDLCIASRSIEEHYVHLRKVLERLREYGLVLNGDKCEFYKDTVTFLRHEVNAYGIKPLTTKVPTPQNSY